MFLENLVIDSVEPQRLGRFWEAALGGERLTDEPDGFETRLAVEGGPVLDLCLPRVAEPSAERPRVLLDLVGGGSRPQLVDRLLGLGARLLDPGGRDVAWVVLADPEGNRLRVGERAAHDGAGPLAAVLLDSAEPDRDAAFWSWLTGWTGTADVDEPSLGHPSLRHPSLRGPLLELCPESHSKGRGKNRMHLDARLEVDDDPDEVAAGIVARGGREMHPGWGELPWRVFADPSGNEFCVLPARP